MYSVTITSMKIFAESNPGRQYWYFVLNRDPEGFGQKIHKSPKNSKDSYWNLTGSNGIILTKDKW